MHDPLRPRLGHARDVVPHLEDGGFLDHHVPWVFDPVRGEGVDASGETQGRHQLAAPPGQFVHVKWAAQAMSDDAGVEHLVDAEELVSLVPLFGFIICACVHVTASVERLDRLLEAFGQLGMRRRGQ